MLISPSSERCRSSAILPSSSAIGFSKSRKLCMSAYLAQPLAPGTPPSRRAESALSRALRFHMPQSGAGIKRPAPLLRECRTARLRAGTSALGDLTRLLYHHIGLPDGGDVDEAAGQRPGAQHGKPSGGERGGQSGKITGVA